MNLKEIADKLFIDSKRTPIRGLSAIAGAEKYLQQAYDGRYFFELIQNVRDANKEKNQEGEVFITLKNNLLAISNTGAEFSTKGIESITTIGKSTKHSQDYIGFKGIGFKSIQEITETPRIVTRYGSIHFDRAQTLNKYNDSNLKEEDIPLFYFPHFNKEKLSEEDLKKGIVTRVELPVKERITERNIINDFSKIKAEQLILLGNIQTLKFESEQNNTLFSIKKEPHKHFIEVKKDDKSIHKFKYFIPDNKIEIPEQIIQSLEGKEKDIFSNSAFVDVNIVLELSETGQIKPMEDAKLYLFYPLQINSGFRFIIHSYFLVNPERTALRNSPFNNFLLASIGKFIGKEMLRELKKTKINTNRILCFKRNDDAKINVLYDALVAELKKQRFIYDSHTQKYFSASDVMVADGFDKGLFPDGQFGGKQLIYADKEEIQWLESEFEISYLTYENIANQIESECKKQIKGENISFFQNLYNYVNRHNKLNLTGRKFLITDDWKLVSSEEDVFYGGNRKKINLAASIKKHIHFIHKGIKFKKIDFREGKNRTGISEFNTHEFVKRMLKLFDKASVPNKDLLNVLYNLRQLDADSELEIRKKILLPIKGIGQWLSPLTDPIYFESDELKKLYPDGYFIDDTVLKGQGKGKNANAKDEFLKKFGVWDIPAIYFVPKQHTIREKDKRNTFIQRFSGLYSKPFYIRNDRVLDIPEKYNVWFTNTIIDNWKSYQAFIQNDFLPKLQYSNNYSAWKNTDKEKAVRLSQWIESLSNEKWICFQGEDEAYSIHEVVGINHFDFSQAHNQMIRKFLKLLPIDFGMKKDLIETIELIHLDGDSIENYKKLLNLIFRQYETNIPEGKEFIDFYNRILGKLVDFFYVNNQVETISQLTHIPFLCINEMTQQCAWEKANQIFYIDDKPSYDLLPMEIKEKVQPHFTKRDKNTFGKIALRIGKKFSNAIEKELIATEIIKTATLMEFFSLLPQSIALLESLLDTVLTPYFNQLRTIRVFEKKEVKVKISVGDSPAKIMTVAHFVDTDSALDLHVTHRDSIIKNKQIAESINELFIHLLERDLRNFSPTLLNYLNASNKEDYLKNYDIVEERINEIRDKLNISDYSSNQIFWIAILRAKGINNRKNLFIDDKMDVNNLSTVLHIKAETIRKIENHFDFSQTSNSFNIECLRELLHSLSLTLEELNETIFPKIDFRSFYEEKLMNLKDQWENNFNAILYNYLIDKDISMKCNYQNYMDTYKYFQFTIPRNAFDLDVESFFLESLSKKFPFLTITQKDLQKDFHPWNPISIYSTNFRLLKNKLTSKDHIEVFLDKNKRRSLLYFNEIDSIVNDFHEWSKNFNGRNTPIEEELDFEKFLSKFSNQTSTNIETIFTKEVDIPPSSSSIWGGNSGKRFDGGLNDPLKKQIGLVAEMIVYEKLKTMYHRVTWVSKFASKVHKTHPGYNPEGQDGLGYDIEYIDNQDNKKYFVEVKGKVDSAEVFEISKQEIETALREKQFYKIFFVTDTMDNTHRRIRNLGNIFILEDGQDFFSNKKFKAIYKSFEIRFQEQCPIDSYSHHPFCGK
jgi:hypothetical protein